MQSKTAVLRGSLLPSGELRFLDYTANAAQREGAKRIRAGSGAARRQEPCERANENSEREQSGIELT